MSINSVFVDSCARGNDPSKKYLNTSAGSVYIAGAGAFGVPALSLNGGWPAMRVTFPSSQTTWFAHFWWSADSLPGSSQNIVSWVNSALNTAQMRLQITPGGKLQFALNNTPVGPQSSNVFSPLTNFNFQFKCIVDSVNGLAELRLAGNPIPILQYTGNTNGAGGAANADSIDFNSINLSGDANQHWSHIVVYDGLDAGDGSPKDYIGMCRADLNMPVSDSQTGGLNQMSTNPAQSAGSHYLNINQLTHLTDDTHYNFGSSPQRESYRLGPLSSQALAIIGVNGFALSRIDDAGPHTYKVGARSNAVDVFGPDKNPTSTYTYGETFFARDPNTSALWLPAAIPNAEIGVEMDS